MEVKAVKPLKTPKKPRNRGFKMELMPKFYTVSKLLDTISEAIGRLDAYNKVTTNTWGAISSTYHYVDVYNELQDLRTEVKKMFFDNIVEIDISVMETKVNSIIKKYNLQQ